jgi:hypothetical protein
MVELPDTKGMNISGKAKDDTRAGWVRYSDLMLVLFSDLLFCMARVFVACLGAGDDPNR